MANFPCSSPPSQCDQSPDPATTYSSETADSPTFIATAYSPNPPLLGKNFSVYPCTAFADSQVSQDDAQLAANRGAVACANPCSPTFMSVEQTVSRNCADGTPYFFTVPAGAFSALSQLQADREALSYGESRIGAHSICLASLSDAIICLNNFFSAEIVVTGSDAPFSFQLVSGTLPPGITMTFQGGTITFTGMPTTLGSFTISIKATNSAGSYTQKDYSFLVTTITTPPTLPACNFGQAYSQQIGLYNPGSAEVTWTIVSGQLPAGLFLNPITGIIAGTPSQGGDFSFTIQAAFDNGACTAAFTMHAFIINFNNLAWSGIINHVGGGGGAASSSFGGDTFTVLARGNGAPPGYVEAIGQMNYTGPTVNCQVTVNTTQGPTSNMGFNVIQDGLPVLQVDETTMGTPGPHVFNFTIAAGTGSLIQITGRTDILDPNRLFVYSFDNNTGAYIAQFAQV